MNIPVEQSDQCAFAAHFVAINGSRLHYLDEGEGDPVVFLHGIPTSSYLWRNILPCLTDTARCIAPDLIGMGQSDKPDIAYSIEAHIAFIEAFIEELSLDNITFVLHGWGSVIGFDIARRYPDRIKGLAFFESHVGSTEDWDGLSLPLQDRSFLIHQGHNERQAIIDNNYFVEHFLPRGVLHTLDDAVMEQYRRPFANSEDRRVLWQYFCDLSLGSGKNTVTALVDAYSEYLQSSDCPKLMLYAVPGFVTPMDTVMWCRDHLKNLTLVDLGNALHFAQESNPVAFGQALHYWYQSLPHTVAPTRHTVA